MAFKNAAATVIARLFQLVNSGGRIVADFGSSFFLAKTWFTLRFFHLDAPFNSRSQIIWSQDDGGTNPTFAVVGPAATDVTDTNASSGYGVRWQGRRTAADLANGSLFVENNRNDGVNQRTANTEYTPGRRFSSVSRTSPTQTITEDLETNAVFGPRVTTSVGDAVNTSVLQQNPTHLSVTSLGTVLRVGEVFGRPGLYAASTMQMHSDQSAILSGNVDVGLNPGAAGRVTLNGKSTFLPLSIQQYNLPGSVTLGFRSFLMNGIAPVFNGVVGDKYIITANCRVVCVVAGGAFIAEVEGFGGGAGLFAQRIIATQWAVNHDASLSATWTFTQTIAGPITWVIVGGQTGGSWTLVAPDSWFTVTHYGIR